MYISAMLMNYRGSREDLEGERNKQKNKGCDNASEHRLSCG